MSDIIAGIDLGTTYSAIAVLNQLGRPEIVPTLDGERILPSALYFLENEGRVVTGVEAINSRYDDTDLCVRWIKHHMGDREYSVKINGIDWSPAEISALLLKKLSEDASVALGKPVTDVVITVPANFGEIARKATMDAGKLAGLNVLGLVNEPTAAAFYYAVSHQIGGRMLIFDLGGGTFDVSVADIKEQNVQIICSGGDRNLGGRHFDESLLAYLQDVYKEEKDGELFDSNEGRAEIEDYLEEIKKSLSRRDKVNVRLNGCSGPLRLELSREKFSELIQPHLSRIRLLIENVVEESGGNISDFDGVLMVGGSSRIPAVNDLIREMFNFEPMTVGNVDECVALGAALCAGFRKISESTDGVGAGIVSGLNETVLRDVCNHSYGTTALKRDELTGRPELKNVILIKKNTQIPCEVTQYFLTTAEDQREIAADVTQGESEDLNMVVHLAQDVLQLPPGRPAGKRVEITYSYDMNERVKCVFKDVESGMEKEFDVDTTLSDDDLVDVSKSVDLVASLIVE